MSLQAEPTTHAMTQDATPVRRSTLLAVRGVGTTIVVQSVALEVDDETISLVLPDGDRLLFDPLELRAAIADEAALVRRP
jgi:hypothetical protein